MTGYLSLVLHAHLPFVRHPEHEEFLEEDWLFEAVTEVYLPLVALLGRLHDEGARPRLALTVSPTLAEMLSDALLRTRYERHLTNLCALAEKELARTRRDAPDFQPAARLYHESLNASLTLWRDTFARDLVAAFGELQRKGTLELLTCCATHGFLPLVSTVEARRAQVLAAVANHKKHFGARPRGIWLPECAYAPGVDELLARAGLEYFVADTHALLFGEPRPRYGVHAPVKTPAGVHVFARDPETGRQVWSAEGGYPGDPFYREFYRDLGFDAPLNYLLPHLHRDGARRHLGLKYHRVTGRDVPLAHKEPYDPARAAERAVEHARHFIRSRRAQTQRLQQTFDGRAPHVLAPYDAELFGHWWYEGPRFLAHVFRELRAHADELALVTPGDFLDLKLPVQTQRPAQSSWGAGGHFAVWLNDQTSWMYPHQHAAEARMTALADRFTPTPDDLTRRALTQAARELLLLQSSDWAFQITHDTTALYAARRFRAHVRRFNALADQLDRGRIDAQQLSELEARDNIFSELDYTVYRSAR